MERRDLLRPGGGALAAGAVVTNRARAVDAQTAAPFKAPAIPIVRVADVGVGVHMQAT